MNEDFTVEVDDGPLHDTTDRDALDAVRDFFEQRRDRVFFSRQITVRHEKTWFHWITNRALRTLSEAGEIGDERRELATGGEIHLMWHRSYRYHRREAAEVTKLVEEYADPNIGAALGLQGEALVLDGFASRQFVMYDREVREYQGREWTETEHDLDFIFERDGIAYGVEVKNKLQYMDRGEMLTKIRLCQAIGVRPVIVARMLPGTWIIELAKQGGFALVLGYQLYPWANRDLAARVRQNLGLPVDTPRRLEAGTMQRFVNWHEQQIV